MSSTQIRNTGIGSLIVIALAVVVLLFTSSERAARALLIQPVPAVTEQQLELALHRVGLDPQRLAAAGLSGSDASDVVGGMFEYLSSNPSPIGFDAAVGEARATVRQLEHLIRSGQGTAQDVSSLQTARGALSTAGAARDAALNAAFAAAVDELSEGEQQLLSTIRANGSWSVPLEFLAINQSEAERVQLRDCLANEKIAAKNDEEPDPGAQAYLQQIRSDLTVAVAKSNLDTNLAIVQTAFVAAISEATQSP